MKKWRAVVVVKIVNRIPRADDLLTPSKIIDDKMSECLVGGAETVDKYFLRYLSRSLFPDNNSSSDVLFSADDRIFIKKRVIRILADICQATGYSYQNLKEEIAHLEIDHQHTNAMVSMIKNECSKTWGIAAAAKDETHMKNLLSALAKTRLNKSPHVDIQSHTDRLEEPFIVF